MPEAKVAAKCPHCRDKWLWHEDEYQARNRLANHLKRWHKYDENKAWETAQNARTRT